MGQIPITHYRKLKWEVGPLDTARVSALVLILLFSACGSKNQINPRLSSSMPPKILWAWERPEDLRFVETREFGVAFLAQTIFLERENVLQKPRRQPLEVAPQTYMIAVTRIETNKEGSKRPALDSVMATKTASLIKGTLDLPDVRAIQVDFDAVVSERGFYGLMMAELKKLLPSQTPLTMTSLASWCTGDAWFNNFPVDEAVPMAFQMGADDEKIRVFLRNGNDWSEPLCRGSYGVSVDDPLNFALKPTRRVYYFSNRPWNKELVAKL